MKNRHHHPNKLRKAQEPYRVNERIKAPKVRLVGDNINTGIYPLTQALSIAHNVEADLVEIAPSADPPVCKVMDYSKFKYEQKKKQKEITTKSQKTTIKEIRMTPTTDTHDIQFKTKHATKFLEEGAKVEAYIQFRGREAYTLRALGEEKLTQLSQNLEDYGKQDGPIIRKGRRSMITIQPHTQNKK